MIFLRVQTANHQVFLVTHFKALIKVMVFQSLGSRLVGKVFKESTDIDFGNFYVIIKSMESIIRQGGCYPCRSVHTQIRSLLK